MDPAAETRSCAHCGSEYLLIRVKPEPGHHDSAVRCVTCDQPMAAWDGDYALKYFLVSGPRGRGDAREKLPTTSHSSSSRPPPR
jgi:hypothetical protein